MNLFEQRGVYAVVLGGGFGYFPRPKGQRLPKLLAKVSPSATVISTVLGAVAYAGFENPVVTIQQLYADVLEPEVRRSLATSAIAFQPQVNGGDLMALECAIRQLPDDWEHILVVLGDMPCWRPSTLRHMVERHLDSNARVTIAALDRTSGEIDAALAQESLRWGRVCITGNRVDGISFLDEKNASLFWQLTLSSPSAYVMHRSVMENAFRVQPSGEKGERRMTTLVNYVCAQTVDVRVEIVPPDEVLGVNTMAELDLVRSTLWWRTESDVHGYRPSYEQVAET